MTRATWLSAALAGLMACSSVALAQTGTPLQTCVVIHDVTAARTTRSDETACATRLSPASTFKIPHALVALETGVVTAGTVERWDGTAYRSRPSWERDHTIVSAMRPSVVWFFQRIAPRVGAARMRGWLERLRYGNADTSGPITQYWINGRLRISPDEQVVFLRRFFENELPIAGTHLARVHASLAQAPGTVENATGIHRLDALWRPGFGLHAKTGATGTPEIARLSWLVGQLSVDGRRYVFAGAAWRVEGEVDALEAARVVVRAFVDRGLLQALPTR
jgi:beta-lactamase class D